ncbi:hypothetical protein K458DRAFT_396730 [Lentithecium fluviatile CBS 122367]|uniref:YCII-related domain-containing protein n=1 Tax=Lentithecium fluviatile CBS 122367 TaxID=1168545 RepID=A0A6G1IEQ2_9PLEO|nr:hypothetical protein K458DRAFT_396730 [Lentithecium fluviatile CBS 122367]
MQQDQQHHWIISIPATITDMNLFKETRPSHIAHLKSLCEEGTIVLSGPTLNEHPKEQDRAPIITGSVWVIKAGTEEEVRQHARENPFAKVGIWSVDAATVQPFVLALRA